MNEHLIERSETKIDEGYQNRRGTFTIPEEPETDASGEKIQLKSPPPDRDELSVLRRKLAVMLSAMSIFFEGVNLSLAGPFFPDQATQKGLNQIRIGWVTASSDISAMTSALIVASWVSADTLKFLNLCGMLWVGVSVGLFGWCANVQDGDTFFYLCIACKAINGVGTTMIQNTVVPISARLFPDNASSVTAVIHTAFGLGLLFGPLMGSVLVPIGGYQLPFIVTGVAEIFTCLAALLVVPKTVPQTIPLKAKVSNAEFSKFLINPKILLFLIPELLLFSTMGFRDSSFSTYLNTQISVVSKDNTGYAFIPFSGSYFLIAPVYGFLVQRGFGIFILMAGQVMITITMFSFYLPSLVSSLESLYYLLPMLFLLGLSVSSIFNPHYLLVEKIALREGYQNLAEIKTLGGSCYNLMAASSRAMGAFVFGGYIQSYINFYNTCLLYACLLGFVGVWQIISLAAQGFASSRTYYSVHSVVPEEVMELSASASQGSQYSRRGSRTYTQQSTAELFLSSVYRSYDNMPNY